MSCEYCRGTRCLICNRDRLSKKGDFYPGISAELKDDQLWIEAVSDTYEPSYQDALIKINFCPMCGDELEMKNLHAVKE